MNGWDVLATGRKKVKPPCHAGYLEFSYVVFDRFQSGWTREHLDAEGWEVEPVAVTVTREALFHAYYAACRECKVGEDVLEDTARRLGLG